MMRWTLALFILTMISSPIFTRLSAVELPKNQKPDEKSQKTTSWEDQLQLLLKKHGDLLNEWVEAEYYGKPASETGYAKQELFNNSHELAHLLSTFQGPKSVNEFEPLFDHHIAITVEYIYAAQQSQPTKSIMEQATQNGKEIADLFSTWYPSYPNTQWRKAIDDFVNLEVKLIDAYFNNDVGSTRTLKEQYMTELKQLGDMLISAIQDPTSSAKSVQKPEKT